MVSERQTETFGSPSPKRSIDRSSSDPCEDPPTRIDDFKPEQGEFVLVHDIGARLPCLFNCVHQVIDFNAFGVSRNMIAKVHVEEVA